MSIEDELFQIEDDIQGWYDGPVTDEGLLQILLNRKNTLNETLDNLLGYPKRELDRLCSNATGRTRKK